MIGFNLAQTFFIDRGVVEDADNAYLTSIELFFKAKPVENKTSSGINKPGVSVYLALTRADGSPDTTRVHHQFAARVEYDNINVDTTGATSTKFTFRRPVLVPTDRSFAFLIKFDGNDSGYQLWCNKAGDLVLGTTAVSQVSSAKVDGSMYAVTNGQTLTPYTDTDITFKLNVAKFTSTSATFKINNRPVEIIKLSSRSGSFLGGEDAYVQAANATGNIAVSTTSTTITGTGTSFNSTLTSGVKFVITDGTPGNTIIRTVNAVTNATSMTIDIAPSFSNGTAKYYKTITGKIGSVSDLSDYVVLENATTNTSIRVSGGSVLYGVDSGASATINSVSNYTAHAIIPNFNITKPAGTTTTVGVNFSNTAYGVSSTNKVDTSLGKRLFLNRYPALIASRDNEVAVSSTFKSFTGELSFETTNPYVSPMVHRDNLDLFVERYEINNTSTNEYLGRGGSKARYISKSVKLAADQLAEDMRVYVRAYRPSGTTIKVYAKMRNSTDNETLDLKDWTELSLLTSDVTYSNPANLNDTLEFEYGVPQFGTGTTATGTFTTTLSNAVAVGTSGTVNTDITVGDVVRLYSVFTPNTYLIDTVIAANTTSITLGKAVANSDLVGNGLAIDVIDRPNSGYLDVQRDNVFTYYNQSFSKFQGYDSFTIKVVLLSEDGVNIPYVDDVRAIAVSA